MQLTPEQVQSVNILLNAVQVAQRRGAFSLQDAATLQGDMCEYFSFWIGVNRKAASIGLCRIYCEKGRGTTVFFRNRRD